MNRQTTDNGLIVKDVVCGMEKPIEEMKEKVVYKEKTYYFCWEGDKNMFLANPEHWIPNKEKKQEVISDE